MYLLHFCSILIIIQSSQSCSSYYKFVNRDIDENSLKRYPWLVVIRNVRDPIFKLCYGSYIHKRAVLTSSLGLVGHTKDDINVETNCQQADLLETFENCTVRKVLKIIHQRNPEDLHNIDNAYDILILETSFDLTDQIKPISLASHTNIFLDNHCFYTRWMREYSTSSNRIGLVTVAYDTPFNDGQFNIDNLDINQLTFDKDWIISRSYHLPFVNISDKHLLNFLGSPLVCKLKQQSVERHIQVGIATFRLTIHTRNNSNVGVSKKGTLINIIPFSSEIMQKVIENV